MTANTTTQDIPSSKLRPHFNIASGNILGSCYFLFASLIGLVRSSAYTHTYKATDVEIVKTGIKWHKSRAHKWAIAIDGRDAAKKEFSNEANLGPIIKANQASPACHGWVSGVMNIAGSKGRTLRVIRLMQDYFMRFSAAKEKKIGHGC